MSNSVAFVTASGTARWACNSRTSDKRLRSPIAGWSAGVGSRNARTTSSLNPIHRAAAMGPSAIILCFYLVFGTR